LADADRYSIGHVRCLLESHLRIVGRPLLDRRTNESDVDIARRLYEAPFAVLAHDAAQDPRFVYGNLIAQRLFERDWDELIGVHSRLSAEAPLRQEREQLLARVASRGFSEDYSGIRIAKSGRRFRILQATVWNVFDELGARIGQAATFAAWQPLD
jgi:hypothetical protein